MDPVSAVGLASAILTFVDVGTKLTRGTLEIYKSATGSTENTAHLKTLARDLHDVTADLQVDTKGGSKHEKALTELAAECRKLSERLLSLLGELTISGERTLHKSLKAKFKSMRKDREVQEIEAKLARYRSQLFLHLNLILREEQSAINVRLEQVQSTCREVQNQNSKQLGDIRQEIIQSIAQLHQQNEAKEFDETSHKTKNLVDGLKYMLKNLSLGMSQFPIENAILKNLYYPSMYDRQSSIGAEEKGTFRWIFEDEGDESLLSRSETDSEIEEDRNTDADPGADWEPPTQNQEGNAHLDLDFEPYNQSHEDEDGVSRISSASQGYEEHMGLENPGEQYPGQWRRMQQKEYMLQHEYRAQIRSTFGNWLKAGDGIFHISGKAGSGKSTLMNFLCEHEKTEDLLLKWAGEKTLVFAKFFFWNPGGKMQSSLQGLYRSILFEVLSNCTELIPRLFPQEWKRLQKQDVPVESVFISDSALKQAFEKLASREEMPKYRFCFFVDGLDEYEGDSKDHVQLAEYLLLWSSYTDVKICASSRPHNEFIHVFSDSIERRMHLHELTARDIYRFTRQTIESDRNFEHVKDDYFRLVDEIVRMSDGVFLWARLVVRSLSAGMLRYDTISALEEKLHHTPKDIDLLYESLFESMDKQDRARAIKMLHLAAHNPLRMSLNAVVFAWIDDLDDPHFPPTNGIKPSSWIRPHDMVAKVERQLAGITKGLLHIVYKHSHRRGIAKDAADGFTYKTRPLVQFLHRSVRDYVLTLVIDEELSMQCKELTSLKSYVRLWIAEMTLLHRAYRVSQWSDLWGENGIETLFREELPLHLLDAVRLLTISDDGDSQSILSNASSISHCIGSTIGLDFQRGERKLSFMHLAAHTSQMQYIARELRKFPTLSTEDDDGLNLLLSAALGCQKDMVQLLLSNGFSAKANVAVGGPYHQGPDSYNLCPIWMIYIACAVQYSLFYEDAPPDQLLDLWDIVKLFLPQSEKDARNLNFVFSPAKEDGDLEIIGLMQMIQILDPHNKDILLRQLDEGRLGRLGAIWRSLLPDSEAKQPNQDIKKYSAYVKDFLSLYEHRSAAQLNGKYLVCVSLGDLVIWAFWDAAVY